VVKANREAPSLRFTSDKAAVPRVTTTAALAAKHAPETAMEAEVAALLEAAGAHSARAVAEAEEALAMKVGRLGRCWPPPPPTLACSCAFPSHVQPCAGRQQAVG
jgi:hypothetical protein